MLLAKYRIFYFILSMCNYKLVWKAYSLVCKRKNRLMLENNNFQEQAPDNINLLLSRLDKYQEDITKRLHINEGL